MDEVRERVWLLDQRRDRTAFVMAGVDFVLVLQVVAFLCAIWLGGRLFKICHQPAILGYLLVGIVMGPQLLDMVPYASDGTRPW